MLRRLLLAGALVIGLVGGTAAPVAAAAGPRLQPVSIVSTMTMADPANYGTFSVSGSGLMCRSGTVLDTGYDYVDVQWFDNGDALVTLDVPKTFTCPNAAQIFVILEAHTYYHDPEANNFIPTAETFTWSVVGGTGRYATLRGQGVGVTFFHAVDGTLLSATNYCWGSLHS